MEKEFSAKYVFKNGFYYCTAYYGAQILKGSGKTKSEAFNNAVRNFK